MIRLLTPASLAIMLLSTGAALADDDDCRSSMAQWQPRDTAIQHVGTLGIEVQRLKVDDGCYEIRGNDADGNRVELRLDPGTLALLELKVRFAPGADASRYLPGASGAGAAPGQTPLNTPLLAPGSTPEVKQD